MEFNFELDKNIHQPQVLIKAPSLTEDIRELMEYLESLGTNNEEELEKNKSVLTVREGEKIYVFKQEEIEFIEIQGEELCIHTNSGICTTRGRLYKMIERLSKEIFVQISKSCVINIYQLERLETYFSGTMMAVLKSGKKVPITRTYLNYVKKKLGF